MNNKFNSKETYLAYRSAWKAEYKSLSAEISLLRQASASIQRPEKMLSPVEVKRVSAARALLKLTPDPTNCGNIIRARLGRSRRATVMLEELQVAKAESHRQYLLSRGVTK